MPSKNSMRRSDWGKLTHSGMGNFLDPPNYPTHNWSVRSVYGDTFSMSLPAAVESDWLNDDVKQAAKVLLDSWKPDINSPDTQDWIRQVMGYFKGMYNTGKGWNVSDLGHVPDWNPVEHQDKHAGVNHIRKFYPDFRLTRTLEKESYWGEKPTNKPKAKPRRKSNSRRGSTTLRGIR